MQLRRLDPHGAPYLLANAASTGLLTVIAVVEVQPGFVLTNGVWAVLSAVGLVRLARTARTGRGATGPRGHG